MTQFSSQITQASAAGEWLGTEPDDAAVERERLERLRKKRLKMVQENPPPASVQDKADEETRQLWANYSPATSTRPSRPAPAPPTPRGSVGRQLSQQSMRPKSPDHPPPGYGGASASSAAAVNPPQAASVPGPAADPPPAAVDPPAAVNPPPVAILLKPHLSVQLCHRFDNHLLRPCPLQSMTRMAMRWHFAQMSIR